MNKISSIALYFLSASLWGSTPSESSYPGTTSNPQKTTTKSLAKKSVTKATTKTVTKTAKITPKKIKPIFGIDVLQGSKFAILKNKKVGLLTNAAGINNQGQMTLELFADNKTFTLKAVFFPEHDTDCFDSSVIEKIKNKKIPLYCTHSADTRNPSTEWLKGLDTVVIDLQGFGMRYYTYYASALYMMCACFQQKIPVIVLDRPNPLGDYIGGPSMDKNYLSFLGPLPFFPLFFPLTIGEFLNYAKNNGQSVQIVCNCKSKSCKHGVFCDVNTLKKGELQVIKAKNYKRKDLLTDLGPFTSTTQLKFSPHITDVASIFEYAVLSLATLAHDLPEPLLFTVDNPDDANHWFRYFYSPYVSSAELLNILKQYPKALSGCEVTPQAIKEKGKQRDCLKLSVKDFKKTEPALFSLVLLATLQEIVLPKDWEDFEQKNKLKSPSERNLKKLAPAQQNALRKAKWDRLSKDQLAMIQKHLGDKALLQKLTSGQSIKVNETWKQWERNAATFKGKIKKFLLY